MLDYKNIKIGNCEVMVVNETLLNDSKVLRFVGEYVSLYLEGFLEVNRPLCTSFVFMLEDSLYKVYHDGNLIMEMNEEGNHNLQFVGIPCNDFQMSFVERRQEPWYEDYTTVKLLTV